MCQTEYCEAIVKNLRRPRYRRALALGFLLLSGCSRPAPSAALPADNYITRGNAKADLKDYDGAIADYNQALVSRPNDADVYYNLGLARSGKDDYAGAVADLDRAIALSPVDAEFYLGRGGIKFSAQDYAAAVADFDQAIGLRPDYTAAFYARALAQRRQGDFDGAFADYDQAIAIDPNYWRAYNGRATAHNAHGDFALAIPDYEKRIALEPEGSEYASFQRSLLLRRLNRAGEDNLAAVVAGWPDGWPKTIGQYLTGHLDGDELRRRAAAPADAQTRREQLCEANYYVGITALLAGRMAEARERFSACVETNVYQFLEFLLARSELARMDAAQGDGAK